MSTGESPGLQVWSGKTILGDGKENKGSELSNVTQEVQVIHSSVSLQNSIHLLIIGWIFQK